MAMCSQTGGQVSKVCQRPSNVAPVAIVLHRQRRQRKVTHGLRHIEARFVHAGEGVVGFVTHYRCATQA